MRIYTGQVEVDAGMGPVRVEWPRAFVPVQLEFVPDEVVGFAQFRETADGVKVWAAIYDATPVADLAAIVGLVSSPLSMADKVVALGLTLRTVGLVRVQLEEQRQPMTLQEYAAACKTTMGYPKNLHPLVPVYPALALNGEAGEFAEKVKKILRDHDPSVPLSAEQRTELLKELGDSLWYITAAAEDLGSSLEEVARLNLDKLKSRKDRGTLHGSGDNR